jgi:hypothetical protein
MLEASWMEGLVGFGIFSDSLKRSENVKAVCPYQQSAGCFYAFQPSENRLENLSDSLCSR